MSQAGPHTSSLAEVLDRILDKGVVIASVDTFLHYAREISRIERAEEEGTLETLEGVDVTPREERA